ncbi:MAG TPA: undecaprenyl-phosphate galactose phosphotransferase WbaP [Planctomycetaceae bacterium]|nr:undecaprenyl-phosphate galactose phosphotransferase WbaP [Planctomycetaceae bacterium]
MPSSPDLTSPPETLETALPLAPADSFAIPRPRPTRSYLPQLLRVGLTIYAADLLAAVVALTGGYLLVAFAIGKEINHFAPFLAVAATFYSLGFWASGVYPSVGMHPARELKQLFRAALCSTLATALGLLLFSNFSSPYLWVTGIAFLLMGITVPAGRSLAKSLMRRLDLGVPFYFVGKRADIQQVQQAMGCFGWTMLRAAGRFGPAEDQTQQSGVLPPKQEVEFERAVPYMGEINDIVREAERNRVHWLFVVGEAAPSKSLFFHFPEVIWINPKRSNLCAGSTIMSCGMASGVRIEESLLLPIPQFQKRIVDCVVAGVALLALSPLFAVIATLIKLSSPGPIFFSHERIGAGGRSFKAWKFRSMVPDAQTVLAKHLAEHPELQAEWDKDHKLKNDPRITWIGRIIRKTSLDELPQLWNVFVGEMSLVGPRPIVKEEIQKYGETFRDYLRVTPGITGLWQISGRNNTTYAQRLAYDEFYVRSWSPWLDLYILMRTVKTVVFCEGAY